MKEYVGNMKEYVENMKKYVEKFRALALCRYSLELGKI